MLSYKDVKFTDYLIKEIAATVGRATDEDVLKYVRVHKDLAKGFQIKKTGCATFRKKIRLHIAGMHELDDYTAEFLYRSGIGQEFVTVLSFFALETHLYEFAAIFGNAAFILALLLDVRTDVNELGCQLLENCSDNTMDNESARTIVADNLRNFFAHCSYISTCTGDPGHPPTEHLKDRIVELERLLKAGQKKYGEISSKLQEAKRDALYQLEVKNERIGKLTVERNELRSSQSELLGQNENQRKELEQLKETFDVKVTAAVETSLTGLTKRWLRNRIQFEQKLEMKGQSAELFAQTEEVLERQAQVDRHTGNRREIQLWLSAVSVKLAEVRDTRANALHPLDELLNVENRLAAEELNLSRLLGAKEDNPKAPLVQALAARINSCRDGESLHNMELLVDELYRLGLPETEYSFLQNRLGDRYDRFVSEHGDHPLPQKPLNPALRFRCALGQGAPLTLVCDGHNILNSMDVFRDVRNRNHAEARKSLSDAITGLLQPYQDCSATIVYDGPDHNRVECSDNVTVIYSGGGKNEKHRADRRIEELLNWRLYTGRTAPVYVVTADYALGQEARESGAEVIPLEHFEWMLAGL